MGQHLGGCYFGASIDYATELSEKNSAGGADRIRGCAGGRFDGGWCRCGIGSG